MLNVDYKSRRLVVWCHANMYRDVEVQTTGMMGEGKSAFTVVTIDCGRPESLHLCLSPEQAQQLGEQLLGQKVSCGSVTIH